MVDDEEPGAARGIFFCARHQEDEEEEEDGPEVGTEDGTKFVLFATTAGNSGNGDITGGGENGRLNKF